MITLKGILRNVIPITCVIGLIGNLLSLIVLRHRDIRSPFHTFLLSLSIAHSIFLVADFIYFCNFPDLASYIFIYVHSTLFYFTRTAAQLVVIHTTLGISVERFTSVFYPLHVFRVFTIKTCTWICVCLWILAVILSLGELAEWLIDIDDEDFFKFRSCYKLSLAVIFQFLVPFFTLAVVSGVTFVKFHHDLQFPVSEMTPYQIQDESNTKLYLWITFTFLACYSFPLIRIVVEIIMTDFLRFDLAYEDPQTFWEALKSFMFYADEEEHFMTSLNSSLAFLLYFTIDQQFRTIAKRIWDLLLIKICCRKSQTANVDAECNAAHQISKCKSDKVDDSTIL